MKRRNQIFRFGNQQKILWFNIAVIGLLLITFACTSIAKQEITSIPTVSSIAEVRKRPVGIPRQGDIIMRSLVFRDNKKPDYNPDLNTLEAIDAFFVNRLEWVYELPTITSLNLAKLRRKVAYLSAAINLNVDNKDYAAQDLSGNYMSSRHLGDNFLMADMSKPDYYQNVLSDINYLIKFLQNKQEIPIIHRDDYRGNYYFLEPASSIYRQPGSFTKETIAKFKKYSHSQINIQEYIQNYLQQNGLSLNTDLRTLVYQDPTIKQFVEFAEQTTIDFYQKLKADAIAPFIFSMNGGLNWSPIEQVFDYGLSEIKDYHCSPTFFHEIDTASRQLNKFNVLTIPKTPYYQIANHYPEFVRTCIATSYASGIPMLVPWDVYMPNLPDNIKTERYYGKKADYQAIYKFIHYNRSLLDQYENAYVTGYIDSVNPYWSKYNDQTYGELQHNVTLEKQYFNDFRYQDNPPIIINQPSFYAYVRAVPQEAERPVVIHLVNWNSPVKPEPRQLQFSLNSQRFFGDKPYKVELLLPDINQKYGTKKVLLATGNPTTLTIDLKKYPIKPWGILVISPIASKNINKSVLAAPYLVAPANNFCPQNCQVILGKIDPNDTIYYRLSNSDNSGWQKYQKPFEIPNNTILEAKTYNQGQWSNSTTINLRTYESYQEDIDVNNQLSARYINEADLISNDNGKVSFNSSVLGGELQIKDTIYSHGISLAHAPGKSLSSLTFKKPQNYNRLYLEIGIDQKAVIDPSFKIVVAANKTVLYETPVFNLPKGEIQNYQRNKYNIAIRLPQLADSVTVGMVNYGLHSQRNAVVLGNAKFEKF